MKTNNDFAGCIGTIVLIILAILTGVITYGWALSVLWEWFIVPIFGLSSISITEAMGIALIIGFLSKQMPSDTKEKDKSLVELFGSYLGSTIFYPFFVVVLGWLISGMI
jgi:hypothetical protein